MTIQAKLDCQIGKDDFYIAYVTMTEAELEMSFDVTGLTPNLVHVRRRYDDGTMILSSAYLPWLAEVLFVHGLSVDYAEGTITEASWR